MHTIQYKLYNLIRRLKYVRISGKKRILLTAINEDSTLRRKGKKKPILVGLEGLK